MILRKQGSRYQLLTLDMPGFDKLYMPGGGIEPDETPDEGVRREIREETGVQPESLRFLRKLGVHQYTRPQTHVQVERHDYLFLAPEDTPDTWSHIGEGEGDDAGERFDYAWVTADDLDQIDPELRHHLTPEHLPEIFE